MRARARRLGALAGAAMAAGAMTAAAVAAPTAEAATATTAAAAFGWGAPIHAEEFTSGTAPSPTSWYVYNSPGHNGQGLRAPQAWSVWAGNAIVHGDANGTTGGMAARWSGADTTYGRWEVRMKTSANRDPKYHPVLILWPSNDDWPCGGEIDFSEGTSADIRRTGFYYHYGCTNKQTQVSIPNDTSIWHTYAVQWTRYGVTGYIDGRVWFQDYDTSHLPYGPMHLTMQLDWFPEAGKATKDTWMFVDWVRQYAPKK